MSEPERRYEITMKMEDNKTGAYVEVTHCFHEKHDLLGAMKLFSDRDFKEFFEWKESKDENRD